jgi:general secretion pathway protein K
MLIPVLMVIVVELAFQAGIEGFAAANVSDTAKIEYAIDGQFEVALALLTYDKKQGEQADSEQETWNASEHRGRAEGDVQLTMRIVDEQGKFNLTRLVTGNEAAQKKAKDYLIRLLTLFREGLTGEPEKGGDVDIGLAEDLADKIVRYLKREGARGQVPKPKTTPANVPLLLDEISFADPKLLPALLVDQKSDDGNAPGLHRYLTVYGTGRINVNTAPLVVLKALFSIPADQDLAQGILDRRRSEPESTPGSGMSGSGTTTPPSAVGGNPFTDVTTQLTDGSISGLTQEVLQRNGIVPAEDLDVKSDSFGVRVAGGTERTQRDELYVVERVKTDGFRFLLHQERTDPWLEFDEDAVPGEEDA